MRLCDYPPLPAIQRWLTTPPADLPRRYLDFYALSNYTHALGLLLHVIFLGVLWAAGITPLALLNVLSVAIFIFTLSASKRGWVNAALLVGGLEVATHQGICVLALGLAPGFEHFILILAIGVLFYHHIPLKVRIVMAILPVLDYMAVYEVGLHHKPWFHAPSHVIDGLAAMNVTFYVAMLMGICIYFQDSVQKARLHAEKMAEAKTIFLANMSHELRTPLNAILGFAQILARSAGLSELDRRNVAIINRSGEHLLQLINDVLDMSKLEEGKFQMQDAPFDLHELLGDLRPMFELAARDKQIELSIEEADDLPRTIRGDSLRVRQILINLLSNAIKFTTQGGVRLSVLRGTAKTDNGRERLLFHVEDTGEGIAPSELPELFQLFTQTASGRQSRKGTGLGLALSKRFVELMGGKMGVESELKKGSVFWFELPVEVESFMLPAHVEPGQVVSAVIKGAPPLMLVVDDNAQNRELLAQLLSGLGFRVECAADGEEALAGWERLRPDLVWMDLRMPVLDGYEATRLMRRRSRDLHRPEPKVVAITASAMEAEATAKRHARFDAYVSKPFPEKRVHEVLTQLLDIEFVRTKPQSLLETPVQRDGDLRATLETVSPALVGDLHRVATVADFDGAQGVIQRIAAKDEDLARRLSEMVESYRFDLLEELTQPVAYAQHAAD